MQPLTIEFLSEEPTGLLRVTDCNWSGKCLILSRKDVSTVLASEGVTGLDVTGIYILIGPSRIDEIEGRKYVIPQIYVGRAERVRARIEAHDINRRFWSSAIVFYREPQLNAAHIDYLEYRLINEATSADVQSLDFENVQRPRAPRSDPILHSDMDLFLDHMKSMLQALDRDLFSPKKALEPVIPVAVQNEDDSAAPEEDEHALNVPENLKRLITELAEICQMLPSATFYRTKTDLRAKYVAGTQFRVFLRISLRQHGLRLRFKDVATYNVGEQASVDDLIKVHIRESYDLATKKLTRP